MSVRLSLDVRLDGQVTPVGRLDALDNGNVQFQYAQDFLDGGLPLSMSLPLDDAPIGDALARAFFGNLLPENDQMQRIIDREGLDRGDIVDILGHVGADCAGAISCLPLGAAPLKVPGNLDEDYRPIAREDLALIVQRLADRQPLPDGVEDPSPVAGVQRKLALTILPDGSYALPKDGCKVPTTHILKVPRRGDHAEALQEETACRLADACGFKVSNSRHVVIEEIDALLIERFDRVNIGGVIYRLHQEDFAQALGLPARLKYERNGTPERHFNTTGIRSLLNRLSRPAQARETFLLATLFNLAIGNTDNHAKNYGILYLPDGRTELTPLYDLLPIRLHHRYTHQLAYHLGGAKFLDDMTNAQMASLLAEFGFEGARARRFIQGPVRSMFETVEARAPLVRKIGQRFFDDLIGRELSTLSGLLNLEIDLRERDHFDPNPAGGWVAAS